MIRPLRGIAAPLVTPLTNDGGICEDSLRRLLDSFGGRVSVLLPGLSSGEGWKLSDAQWQSLMAATMKHAGNMPVYPGIIGGTMEEILRKAARAAAMGASGVTIPVPWDSNPTTSGVVDYFRELAQRSPLPVFVYNTEPADSDERMAALTDICCLDQVVAIKESSRQPAVANRLIALDERCAVFQGWEDCCLATRGIDGYALALVNLEPALCADMFAQPDEEKQNLLIASCGRHRLFDTDWYAQIKTELQRRGMLANDNPISEPSLMESDPC